MNTKLLKLAALLMALCVTLAGCNLIAVDPVMQIAEDRASLEQTYQTVLAEYDGGVVTVGDIIYDFNTQWSYYYQIYSMYGSELTEADVQTLVADCVDVAVERVAQDVEAERRGIELTAEEVAEVEEGARSIHDSTYEVYYEQLSGDTEQERDALTELEIYASGQDYDAQLKYQTSTKLAEKLREQVDAEIAEPTEEDLLETYDTRVAEDEEYYAEDTYSFETAMTSGTAVTWMPEGYRTVKHILVIPDASVLDPYTEKKSELDALTEELTTLNDDLLAATDDDETTGDASADPEAIQAQIDEKQAEIDAAEAELESLAEACFADVQDTLDEIQARIDAGEDFDALIAEYGEDPGMQNEPTASSGYYVCAESTTWDTAFRDAAMLLSSVGDVSEHILGTSGVHIIRYESDVTPGAVPFEDVRDALYDETLSRLREESYAAQLEEWVAALDPVYHYDAWDPLA